MNVKYVQHNTEMDRIAEAFSGYIHRHPNLDLLWSDKAGYLILTINSETQRVDEENNFLSAPALAYRLFYEIALDVTLETESGNRCDEMTEEEIEEVKQRWAPFLEMLPEYNRVCEDILVGNRNSYIEYIIKKPPGRCI